MKDTDVESLLDRLYDSNPSDFVKHRDKMAREAKKAGNTEAAARLKSAKKPTVVAAALNRLALRNRKQLEWLAEADARVREALASGGGAADVREATLARREIVGQLVDAASKHMAEGGTKATSAVKEKISQLLSSMSTDETLRDAINSARLVKEPEAGEFTLPESGPASRTDDPKSSLRKRVQSLEKELEELELSRKTARDESSRLQEIADRAVRVAEQAAEKLERAEKAADEKRRELGDARREL